MLDEPIRVDAWVRPQQTAHFTPWGGDGQPRRRASDLAPRESHGHDAPAEPTLDIEAVRAGLANDWADAAPEGEGIVLSSPISIARHVIRAWLDARDALRAGG